MRTILIIEDETSLLDALAEKLSRENFSVLKAKNGQEGIRIALKEHPDCVLLDIIMPSMDGLEAAKVIRQDEWGAKVPIIVLTNADEVTRVEQALDINILKYLVKSNTSIDHVVDVIRGSLAPANTPNTQ